ncbi:hypothetical protein ACA910_014328 [Epithemia clementina (nom. ined.)]
MSRVFQWTRNFEALKDKFLDSKRFPDGENNEDVKLKRWIENQWAKYEQFDSEGGASCMIQEWFDRLKKVGFAEYMSEAHWKYRYEKVKALLEENNNWNPPSNYYLYMDERATRCLSRQNIGQGESRKSK